VKSLWKAFSPRVATFFMDQISDHQRDLTNSASSRFVGEYLSGFAFAADRMLSVLSSLNVDRARMARNISLTGDLVFSESVYILIGLGGDPEAHEKVRSATLAAERSGERLADVLKRDAGLWSLLSRQLEATRGMDAATFFEKPAHYTGIAGDRARAIAEKHARSIDALRRELGS